MRSPILRFSCLLMVSIGSGCTPNLNQALDGGGDDLRSQARCEPGFVGTRLLSSREYSNSLNDLFKSLGLDEEKNYAEELPGYKENQVYESSSSANAISSATLDSMFSISERESTRLAEFVSQSCQSNRSCWEEYLEKLAKGAFRGMEDSSDISRYTQLIRSSSNLQEEFQIAATAVLTSPFFLYRVENREDERKFKLLSHHEIANRLSYTLLDSSPDAELRQLADEEKLHSKSTIKKQIRRMLGSKSKRQKFIDRFVSYWFGIEQIYDMQSSVPQSIRKRFETETKSFMDYILKEERPLSDILLANYSFMDTQLASHYGFPYEMGDGFEKISLENSSRQGILSHGSLLMVTSDGTNTSPVKRGIYLLSKVLCESIGDQPDLEPFELETEEPDGTPLSVAEMLERHRSDPSCAGCHSIIDPLGLGLESYDAKGIYRRYYDNGAEVVSEGILPNGGSFSTLKEFVTSVSETPDFKSCVTQKFQEFTTGRNTEKVDECSIEETSKSLSTSDSTLLDVIESVLTSDAFIFNRNEDSKE